MKRIVLTLAFACMAMLLASPALAQTAVVNGPYAAETGADVTFDAAGSSDGGDVLATFVWDFGDGTASAPVLVSDAVALADTPHAYTNQGFYTATLTVTLSDGTTSDSDTAVVTITDPATTFAPANQIIGMYDTEHSMETEADCRACHETVDGEGNLVNLANTHHVLYYTAIPDPSVVPNPDVDGTPGDDTYYTCFSCHDSTVSFDQVERDCLACHTDPQAGHHASANAISGDCQACHGYVVAWGSVAPPAYNPSLITPSRTGEHGQGGGTDDGDPGPTFTFDNGDSGYDGTHALPPNYDGPKTYGPGGCDYCHNALVDTIPTYDPTTGEVEVLTTVLDENGDEVLVEVGTGDPVAYDSSTPPVLHFVDENGDLIIPNDPAPAGAMTVADEVAGASLVGEINTNYSLHHHVFGTGGVDPDGDGTKLGCATCHTTYNYGTHGFEESDGVQMRVCENCHSRGMLHNTQVASSGDPADPTTVGGEDAGFGHVGRDAGPGDSDCWGCHGFDPASISGVPGDTSALIPTVYACEPAALAAGTATQVTVSGAVFVNTTNDVEYSSSILLTDADGASVTLSPDSIDGGTIVATIPADLAAGKYLLQAVKTDAAGEPVTSNSVALMIAPNVTIDSVTADGGYVTITGSGFSGYGDDTVTSVAGTVTSGKGKKRTSTTVTGTIDTWSDTQIEVAFDSAPSDVTVTSVFGSATADVGSGDDGGKPDKGDKPGKGKNK